MIPVSLLDEVVLSLYHPFQAQLSPISLHIISLSSALFPFTFFARLLHTCRRSATYCHDFYAVLASQVSSACLTLCSFHNLAHPTYRTLTTCVPRSHEFISTAQAPILSCRYMYLFLFLLYLKGILILVCPKPSLFSVSLFVRGICIHLSCAIQKTITSS